MANPTFSRRSALLKLAAIPITMSFARSLQAQTAGTPPPKRLVIFMQNNGTKRGNFWPTAPAGGGPVYPLTNTPILTSLFTSDGTTDNGLKAKTNIIRGLQVTSDVSTNGNQHDIGFARMFTGAQLMPTADGAPWAGAASIDQIVANDWNIQSLTTAVYASSIESHPKKGFDNRASFSYVAPQQLNLPVVDPLTAYTRTFPQSGAGPASTRLLTRKSVLDAVTGDLQELAGRLGPDDNQKLDFHLTAVRDAETKISNLLSNHGTCAYPATAPQDFLNTPPGLANNEVNLETYVPQMIDAMVTLIGTAIKCGLTRVGSLQFGYGGGKWFWDWEKLDINHHDDVAHHDIADDTGTTADLIATTARVTTINQYYASVVAKLATDLNSAPEGSGTILDNTLVIWANEMGRGDHQLTDIPAVMIGLVGNGISQGGRLIDVSALRGGQQQPHNILGYHALNALGHTTAGFGDITDMSSYAIPGF
jgi:Protein of unknown function (DUF1552)